MSDKTPIRTLNGHPLVDETARQSIEELNEKVTDLEENGVGVDGGYYTPSVSSSGLLSWEASKDGMKRVDPVSIRGPEGPAGKDGEPGSQGPPGEAGAPGADGVSVTVKSVSQSGEDGGKNIVKFSDGTSVTVLNGSKGPKGDTPVKGTDYWTEADKTELATEIVDETPVVRYDKLLMLTTEQASTARTNVGIAIGVNVPNAANPVGWSSRVSSYAAGALVCHNGKLYIRLDYWDGELNPEPGTDDQSWGVYAVDSAEVSTDPDILFVTFTSGDGGSTFTADKTYAEMYAAFTAGQMLYAKCVGELYPLEYCDVASMKFASLRRETAGIYEHRITVDSADNVSKSELQVTIAHLGFPSAYRGNLIYVNSSGKAQALRLGDGLKVENGVLMLDGTVTPDTPVTPSKTAICGTFLAGEVLCGEV